MYPYDNGLIGISSTKDEKIAMRCEVSGKNDGTLWVQCLILKCENTHVSKNVL